MKNKLIMLVVALAFSSSVFAQRVKEIPRDIEQKSSEAKSKQDEKSMTELLAEVAKGAESQNVQKGLKDVFAGDVLKQISFGEKLVTLSRSQDQAAQKVANYTKAMLSSIAGLTTSKPELAQPATILLQNFEMAMTEMSDAAAIQKYETHLMTVGYHTVKAAKGEPKTAEEIELLGIANAFKNDIEGSTKSSEVLDNGYVTSIDKQSDAVKKEIKRLRDEWKTKCGPGKG